jgi:hypothetical protein
MTAVTAASQAHALRAAAALIERTGLAGLSVTAEDSQIDIWVPRHAGTAAVRTASVTAVAGAIGAPAPACTPYPSGIWVASAGLIAGHRTRVITTISTTEEETA